MNMFLKESGTGSGRLTRLIFAAILLLTTASGLLAQTDGDKKKKSAADNTLSTQERLDILAEEIEKLKLKRAIGQYREYNGHGPAASKVYYIDQGISFGGYGEVKYRDYRSDFKKDQVDVHRLILYTGYKFNDWILLNTEIEYEHAGFVDKSPVDQPEVFVEFAYLDLQFAKWFKLQAGLLLMPMGITNYLHEPTTFWSVERPQTESAIIPSTWREIGLMAHGRIAGGKLLYRLGIFNGPKGANMSAGTWMRSSRTKGSQARAEDFAYVFGLEYDGIEGLVVGGSYFRADADQDEIDPVDWKARLGVTDTLTALKANDASGLTTALLDQTTFGNKNKAGVVRIHLAEAHFRYDNKGIVARGLFARGWMNEESARNINASTGKNVGKVVEGGYIELGYDIFTLIKSQKQKSRRLIVFVRNEYVNTQKETVQRHLGGQEDIDDAICAQLSCSTSVSNASLGIINGSSDQEAYGIRGVADRVNDRRIITTGVAFFPHPNVVFKADYEKWSSKTSYHGDVEWRNSSNNKIHRFNMSLGFIY